ncbi:MAG: hypothetical protein AAGF48_10860 [Pseudomonadota bacterium]
MLKSITAIIAAVLSMGLATPAPAYAQYAAMSRQNTAQPPRLGLAEIRALRNTRAQQETPNQKRSTAKVAGSRTKDAAWLPPRIAEELKPNASRTPVRVRPHATDPGVQRQTTTRSSPLNVRATATPAPQRVAPLQAPRMKVSRDTRTSRASFEDWLFGR